MAAIINTLAGLLYGLDVIPANWLGQLALRADIEELTERMEKNILGC